jgi:hypothetical protein
LRPRPDVVLPSVQRLGGVFQKINNLNNGNTQESSSDNEKSAASAPKINKLNRKKPTWISEDLKKNSIFPQPDFSIYRDQTPVTI